MAISKVIYNNQTLMDLTSDTVAAATLKQGETAHGADGEAVTGNLVVPSNIGTIDTLADGTWPSGDIVITVPTIAANAFTGHTAITSARGEDVTSIKGNAFSNMRNFKTAFFPNATCEGSYNFSSAGGSDSEYETIVIGSFGVATYICYRDKNLKAVDVVGSTGRIGQMQFANNAAPVTAFDTLILRSTSIITLHNINAFNYTKFASGQSGGTIYIPKSLYDHLGDGSSSDYKAASNWSAVNGYGTITWAKIEGSYYETHYADGTVISTT